MFERARSCIEPATLFDLQTLWDLRDVTNSTRSTKANAGTRHTKLSLDVLQGLVCPFRICLSLIVSNSTSQSEINEHVLGRHQTPLFTLMAVGGESQEHESLSLREKSRRIMGSQLCG